MKLGHEFYPLKSLKCNQKNGVFLKKPQNSGKLARIFIPHANGHLSPVHEGYTMSVAEPPGSCRSWPLQSWVQYPQSRLPLVDTIDWSWPLIFILRGDVYLCAGGSWTQLSIGLLNHGKRARTPAYLGVIGMAVHRDKDMAALSTIWAENLQVFGRFVH